MNAMRTVEVPPGQHLSAAFVKRIAEGVDRTLVIYCPARCGFPFGRYSWEGPVGQGTALGTLGHVVAPEGALFELEEHDGWHKFHAKCPNGHERFMGHTRWWEDVERAVADGRTSIPAL